MPLWEREVIPAVGRAECLLWFPERNAGAERVTASVGWLLRIKTQALAPVSIIYYIVSGWVASTTLCNCSVMPGYHRGLLSCLYWIFRLFYLIVYVRAKE